MDSPGAFFICLFPGRVCGSYANLALKTREEMKMTKMYRLFQAAVAVSLIAAVAFTGGCGKKTAKPAAGAGGKRAFREAR